MKLGSLCTGIGGLDLAVEAGLGAELAWCAEIDPAASAVLAHRFPGVPNLGDFTKGGPVEPEPVDVLCAGFPCQPVSTAGRRLGTEDERWLFDDILDLVGRMEPRPRLLVFENVLGLLSANDGDALARVVQGLAASGYVGSWRVVRASDVGAPHQRARWFCVAADADGAGSEAWGERSGRGDARRPQPVDGRDPSPADADDIGYVQRCARPGPASAPRGRHQSPADAEDLGRERGGRPRGRRPRPADCHWGPYEPAIRRWEHILGRPAPAPVDARGRLNPALVEWMMGYQEGWVTDVTDRRTDALRMLGNAVVPQQAELALRMLLEAAS